MKKKLKTIKQTINKIKKLNLKQQKTTVKLVPITRLFPHTCIVYILQALLGLVRLRSKCSLKQKTEKQLKEKMIICHVYLFISLS